MTSRKISDKKSTNAIENRREFILNSLMGTGLVASHLTAAGLVLRYLYPTGHETKQKIFVGLKSEIPPGTSLKYEAPGGKTINIVRAQEGFIALSDVCPHLGCRVHWEAGPKEFFCPCHAGRFDAGGRPISGPPAEMGAGLPKYEIAEDGDMVFIVMGIA